QHHCTSPGVAFSTKRKGFFCVLLDVTPGEVQRQREKPLGSPRIWAFGGYRLRTLCNWRVKLDEALKGYRDGEFHTEIRKQSDQSIAEEGTVHPNFDVNAGQSCPHCVDTGEDEILRAIGVMHISWSVEDIENLSRLSDRAE